MTKLSYICLVFLKVYYMRAMVLNSVKDLEYNSEPLEMIDFPKPIPAKHEVLIKVLACGVCHTELDEIEGRTPPPRFPVVPGHQVVGIVESTGRRCPAFNLVKFSVANT